MSGRRDGASFGAVLLGFMMGLAASAAVAAALASPEVRESMGEIIGDAGRRLMSAMYEGMRVGRQREAELEALLLAEERGVSGEGPDFIV
jgi:hypothetical protein